MTNYGLATEMMEALTEARRERDAARVIIARVELLCDSTEFFGDEIEVADIRAALDVRS